jgi:DNA-binding IclR family transcriptional regulator
MARAAPAIDRVVQLMNMLAAHHGEQLTLSQIALRLGFNAATCHSMLNTLVDAAVLVRNPETKRYALGPTLVTWGMASAFDAYRVLEFAEPEMARLRQRLGVSCVARALVGHDVVVLARRDNEGPIASFTPVGYRVPATPPIGAEFVAWEQDATVDEWLARPQRPLTDIERAQTHDLLAKIRRDHYRLLYHDAESASFLADLVQQMAGDPQSTGDPLLQMLQQRGWGRGPRTSYINGVTAAIFGPDAKPVLTLLLTVPPQAADVATADRYVRPLLETCRRLTRAIGGRLPPSANAHVNRARTTPS